jgi:hypothetical protein
VPVLIASDIDCNAPGLTFAAGEPVEVDDLEMARQLLALPHMHEVPPDGESAVITPAHGRHERPDDDPAAVEEATVSAERTAVTEPAPEPVAAESPVPAKTAADADRADVDDKVATTKSTPAKSTSKTTSKS